MSDADQPLFIRGRVAVTKDGPIDEKDITSDTNVIFIRTKMDFGTTQRVLGAGAKMVQKKQQPISLRNQSARNERRMQSKTKIEAEFDIGEYNKALLVHNILGWQGPMFAGVNCNSENISAFNQDHPLVARTLKEINDRNVKKTDQDDDLEDEQDENIIDGDSDVIPFPNQQLITGSD